MIDRLYKCGQGEREEDWMDGHSIVSSMGIPVQGKEVHYLQTSAVTLLSRRAANPIQETKSD